MLASMHMMQPDQLPPTSTRSSAPTSAAGKSACSTGASSTYNDAQRRDTQPMLESSGDDSFVDPDDAAMQVPVFTPQDEQKELAEMTITDIIDVQSDLTGVTLGMGGLSVSGPAAAAATGPQASSMMPPLPLSTSPITALSLLELEMSKLPTHLTAAYRRAQV